MGNDFLYYRGRGRGRGRSLSTAGPRWGFVGCSFTAEAYDGSANSQYYAYAKACMTYGGGVLGGPKIYATQGYGIAEILSTHVPTAVAAASTLDGYVLDTGFYNNGSANALHPLTTAQMQGYIETAIAALLATGKPVIVLEPFPSGSAAGQFSTAPVRAAFRTQLAYIKALNGRQAGLRSTQTIVDTMRNGASDPDDCYYQAIYTRDGVHGNAYGYGIAGKLLADKILSLYTGTANYYQPTGAENVLNSTFTGTAGTAGTGVTGTVPTSWEFLRVAGAATATCTATGAGMEFAITGNTVGGTPAAPTFDSQIRLRFPSAAKRDLDASLAPGDTYMATYEVDSLSGYGYLGPNILFYNSASTLISAGVKLEANPTTDTTDWRDFIYTVTGQPAGKARITAFWQVPADAAKFTLSVSVLGDVSGTIKLVSVKKV